MRLIPSIFFIRVVIVAELVASYTLLSAVTLPVIAKGVMSAVVVGSVIT